MKAWRSYIDGYIILILSLIVFALWGINLFSVANKKIDVLDPLKSSNSNQNAAKSASVRKITAFVRPFLYFYFYELGYTLYVTSSVPPSSRAVMIMINPPLELPLKFLDDLENWVTDGGKLFVFFNSFERCNLLERIEAKQASCNDELVFPLSVPWPWLKDAAYIDGCEIAWYAHRDQPFIRPYGVNSFNFAPILVCGRGKGCITITSSNAFATFDGLRKSSNLVFVTRLVERFSYAKELYFFDVEPNRKIEVLVASGVGKKPSRTFDTRSKSVPDISLWSILRANPVSWALVQLFIALIIFAFSISRRFGPVSRNQNENFKVPSFMSGMASLLRANGSVSFAAAETLTHFLPAAMRRFNLPTDAPPEKLIEILKSVNPAAAEKVSAAIAALLRLRELGAAKDEARLLRSVQTLAQIRKEFHIYG